MNFTRYYSSLIASQGLPHLNLEQHQCLFNIISLEARIDELGKVHNRFRHLKEVHLRKDSLSTKLENLTLKQQPEDVMKDMLLKSQE